MKTFFLNDSNNYTGPAVSALVLGNFDGVHLGHNELFKKARSINGEKEQSDWALMTFEPHPKDFFNQEGFTRIYSPKDTLTSLELSKIDLCLIYNFDKSLAYKSAKDFLNEVVLKVNPTHIVIGEDFMFGKNRSGSIVDIKQWAELRDIKVDVVNLKKHIKEDKISSTFIRKLLSEGDIEKANSHLLNPFFISGDSVREKGLASKIGFPTINVRLDHESNLRFGVYCSKILINKNFYNSITNFGMRPTINSQEKKVSMETHVLSFPDELLGVELKEVRVDFLKFIRPESRFESVEELQAQIKKDVFAAKAFFETN